jgi:hypothetical protein
MDVILLGFVCEGPGKIENENSNFTTEELKETMGEALKEVRRARKTEGETKWRAKRKNE